MYTRAKEKRDDVKVGDFVFELRKKKMEKFRTRGDREEQKVFVSLSFFACYDGVRVCGRLDK